MNIKLRIICIVLSVTLLGCSNYGLASNIKLDQNKEVYSPEECPIVGNTDSKKYHKSGQQHYRKMLILNKDKNNNRVCFPSESDAQNAGYVASKR